MLGMGGGSQVKEKVDFANALLHTWPVNLRCPKLSSLHRTKLEQTYYLDFWLFVSKCPMSSCEKTDGPKPLSHPERGVVSYSSPTIVQT